MHPEFRPSLPRSFIKQALLRILTDVAARNGKCFNLGCGVEGRYDGLLSRFEVEGVDIADPGARPMPWRFHVRDAQTLPLSDATFDLSVAIESFAHIDENMRAMREVARILKSGGCSSLLPQHI